MTISTENIRNDYTGNGVTTTFPYTFKAFANNNVRVLLTDTGGTTTEQTLTTHYSLTGVGTANGGNVVFVTAPTNLYTITILADIPITQTTDLVNETSFFQDRIETALDRSVRMAQILDEVKSRSLRLPELEVGSDTTTVLPALASRKGMTLAFDATTGQPTTVSTSTTAISAAMIPVVQAATLATARSAMNVTSPADVATSIAAAISSAMLPVTQASTTALGLVAMGAQATYIEKTGDFTAELHGRYHVTATLTVTDPTPAQAHEYHVFVRNGTATVGGTAYPAGTLLTRSYHSGAWATYVTMAENATIAVTGTTTATVGATHIVSGVSGDYTITLPAASSYSGLSVRFVVKDYALANAFYTLDATGTVKIGGNTRYLVIMHTNSVHLQSDGTNWVLKEAHLTTPWIAYAGPTPSATTTPPTKGTTTTDQLQWRRSGDSLQFRYDYVQSAGGANGTGTYLIPFFFTADTNKVRCPGTAVDAQANSVVGCGQINGRIASVIMYDSTRIYCQAYSDAAGGLWGSGMGWSGTNWFQLRAEIPIVNW